MEEKFKDTDKYSFCKDYKLIEKLMDNFPFGIILLDNQANLTYYNSQFIKIIDQSQKVQKVIEWFQSDDNIQKQVRRYFKDKSTEPSIIEVVSDGDIKIIKIFPIYPENGELLLIFEDVTRRKKAEAKLKEREEYQRTIFSAIQTGIMVVDCDTKVILDVNDVAADLIGLSRDEIIGNKCHKFVCPAEESNCPIIDLKQEVDNSERIMLDKNKKEIPIIKTVVPVTLNGREALLESFIDITERKEYEKALKRSEEKYKAIVEKFLRSTMALMNEINR
ncbi:MAG: PAS domain-containing protein [Methanobacteriaceae archaeon]|nr:PAS domain-containing protein [Methanobacteriaceae archaeon]